VERTWSSDGVPEPQRLPGHPHLALGIPGLEESGPLLVAALVQSLMCLGEQTSGPEQRIALPTKMSEQFPLNPPAALVHQLGREFDGPVGADPDEEDLVETEYLHVAEPVGIVDEDLPVGDDGVVDRVPPTAQVDGTSLTERA
jgi:hypothetical protein